MGKGVWGRDGRSALRSRGAFPLEPLSLRRGPPVLAVGALPVARGR